MNRRSRFGIRQGCTVAAVAAALQTAAPLRAENALKPFPIFEYPVSLYFERGSVGPWSIWFQYNNFWYGYAPTIERRPLSDFQVPFRCGPVVVDPPKPIAFHGPDAPCSTPIRVELDWIKSDGYIFPASEVPHGGCGRPGQLPCSIPLDHEAAAAGLIARLGLPLYLRLRRVEAGPERRVVCDNALPGRSCAALMPPWR